MPSQFAYIAGLYMFSTGMNYQIKFEYVVKGSVSTDIGVQR